MSQAVRPANRPGRPAPEHALTPPAVAAAALALIDAEGLEAFSMRRLGQNLGVEAMALYNHFEDKEAILNAVADLALSRVPAPPPTGSWRARIKRVCGGVRALAQEHPHLFRLALTRPLKPAAALPLSEGLLAALADAGLNPAAQATAFHTCFLYTRGFCLWEIDEFGPDRASEWAAVATAAPEYARSAAAARVIFSPDVDRLFEAGLDTILRGLPRPPQRA